MKLNKAYNDQKCTPCVGEAPDLHIEQTQAVPYMAGKLLLNHERMTDDLLREVRIGSGFRYHQAYARSGSRAAQYIENPLYYQ